MDRKALAAHLITLDVRTALSVLEHADPSRVELLRAGSWGITLEQYAIERVTQPGCAYALMSWEGPIAIGGMRPLAPGVSLAWVVGGPMIHRYARAVLLSVRTFLRCAIRSRYAHRIEAQVRADDETGHRFIRRLGFTFESWASQATHDRVALGVYSFIEGRDEHADHS